MGTSNARMYTVLKNVFVAKGSGLVKHGALGFLEAWAIDFDTKDDSFQHDSQISLVSAR